MKTSSRASATSTSPHTVGLPPLRSYLRELWRRREFAYELARTKLREQNFDTVFGQLWLVLNPLLLALVYFILVDILRASDSRNSEFFAHLVAGLFAFMFIHNAMTVGVRSVTKGGRLILNSAFPRALLPLSAVITAFMRFMPDVRRLHPGAHRLGAAGQPDHCCG